MSSAGCTGWRGTAAARGRMVWLLAVLVIFSPGVFARPVAAAPFERGEIFLSTVEGILQYSPAGTLISKFGEGSASDGLCFDPSGNHLVVPGVGLFDRNGNELPSNWGSAASTADCAVDGYGQVYVAGGPSGGTFPNQFGSFRKYDLNGDLLKTYTVNVSKAAKFGTAIVSVALGPDQCTVYWDVSGGSVYGLFNACTETPENTFARGPGFLDGLRVRANGQIVAAVDEGAELIEGLGEESQAVAFYRPPRSITSSFRYIGLDPDGQSFWLGSVGPVMDGEIGGCAILWRLDLETGQTLNVIPASCSLGEVSIGGVAVYGTPGAAPTVKRVAPKKGVAGGGTSVVITGTGFMGATAVKFGPTSPAASFTVNSPTSITAITPAATAGTVDVTVTNGPTSEVSSKDHFKFGPPTVTGVSPSHGAASGGGEVTVTGSGFAVGVSGTTFAFGGAQSTAVNCASTTSCTATVPPHKAGGVDVRATVAGIKSKKNAPADTFTYE